MQLSEAHRARLEEHCRSFLKRLEAAPRELSPAERQVYLEAFKEGFLNGYAAGAEAGVDVGYEVGVDAAVLEMVASLSPEAGRA